MRTALIIAFVGAVLGCAGVQGIPVAPRPPAFSPVTDAPITIGQPGHVRAPLPRSPHSRELPQTPETRREDGLWASNGPDSPVPERHKGEPIPRITLVEVDVPVAPEAADAWDTLPTEHCAHIANEDLRAHGMLEKALDLPAAKRKCVAAILMFKCIGWASQHEWVDRTKWASDAASTWVRKACTERAKGPDIDAVLEGVGIRGGAQRWTN